MAPSRRDWAIFTVFFIFFVDLFQVTFVFPLIPMLVASFGGSEATVSARVAFLSSLGAVGSMVGSPVLGWLSDKLGRKPIFLVSTLGSAASAVIFGIAPSWQFAAVARLINGVSGGTGALANTYLIDITEDDERPKYMSRMTGVAGLGLTAGPIAGGFLVRHYDVAVACYCAGVISLLNFACIVFLLADPKTVKLSTAVEEAAASQQSATDGAGAEEGRPAVEAVPRRKWCRPASKRQRFPTKLYILFVSGMFLSPVSVVFDTFANLYVSDRFYDGDQKAGTALFTSCVATIGVCLLIVPLFLYSPFVKVVGFNGSIVIGISTVSLGLILNGLASKPWMFLACAAIWAFGFQLLGPFLPILIGRLAPKEALGKAFGLFQSFCNVSMVIGPGALTPLYNWYHPAVFFFLGGSLIVAGSLILYVSVKTPAPPSASGEAGSDEPGGREDTPEVPPVIVRQASREINIVPGLLRQLSRPSLAEPMLHRSVTLDAPPPMPTSLARASSV